MVYHNWKWFSVIDGSVFCPSVSSSSKAQWVSYSKWTTPQGILSAERDFNASSVQRRCWPASCPAVSREADAWTLRPQLRLRQSPGCCWSQIFYSEWNGGQSIAAGYVSQGNKAGRKTGAIVVGTTGSIWIHSGRWETWKIFTGYRKVDDWHFKDEHKSRLSEANRKFNRWGNSS